MLVNKFESMCTSFPVINTFRFYLLCINCYLYSSMIVPCYSPYYFPVSPKSLFRIVLSNKYPFSWRFKTAFAAVILNAKENRCKEICINEHMLKCFNHREI